MQLVVFLPSSQSVFVMWCGVGTGSCGHVVCILAYKQASLGILSMFRLYARKLVLATAKSPCCIAIVPRSQYSPTLTLCFVQIQADMRSRSRQWLLFSMCMGVRSDTVPCRLLCRCDRKKCRYKAYRSDYNAVAAAVDLFRLQPALRPPTVHLGGTDQRWVPQ